MQAIPRFLLTLFLLLSTVLTLSTSYPPRIKCDTRSKPPKDPSFQDCSEFLWELSIKAHAEPQGSYKWYGREIDACTECVKLPTIIHIGTLKCATVIDVDDARETDLSIFGLTDLNAALSDVIGTCWLRQMHNGVGYPGAQAAWAGLIKGFTGLRLGGSVNDTLELEDGADALLRNEMERWRNRTVSVIDLSAGWPGRRGVGGTAAT
ncbi:MAG: hypothetical protein Q9191_002173, partial [Dirinaria sp. TL-2023a]